MREHNELSTLIEKIMKADDFAWGFLTLSEDPLYNLFSPEIAEEIVQEAILCGHHEAERLLEMYPGRGPEGIAEEIGLPVREADFKTTENSRMVYFGHYTGGVIVIPEDLVKEIGIQWKTTGLSESMGEIDARSLMIGHELFHYCEDRNKKLVTSTMKVRVKLLKFFHQNVTPLCASEIAAFAFARKVAASAIHPQILEIVGIYGIKPDLSRGIVKRLTSIVAGRTNM